jgi:hypothetical protein
MVLVNAVALSFTEMTRRRIRLRKSWRRRKM